jgi:hypothetical protein
MEKVSLHFQTPQDLTNFRLSVEMHVISTDVANLVIYCECSREVIARAMTEFGAVVKDIPGT